MAEKKSSRKKPSAKEAEKSVTNYKKDEKSVVTDKEIKNEMVEAKKKPDLSPTPSPPPTKSVERVAQVTFTRWFNAMVQKGKHKPHHKAGMNVHIGKLKARRSVAEWNKLFETY